MTIADDILSRLKIQKGWQGHGSDALLAKFLSVHRQTIANWRNRGKIDYEVLINKCADMNLHWLFTGKESAIGTSVAEYEECRKKLHDCEIRCEAFEKALYLMSLAKEQNKKKIKT